MFRFPGRALWRLLSRLPDEPQVAAYAHVQEKLTRNDLAPIEDASALVSVLEEKGLYRSSALCRFHSEAPIDYAKLVETGLVLNVLDERDLKPVLATLVKHQSIPHFQYVLGRILLPTKPEEALKKLKEAGRTVPKARQLYAQHLVPTQPEVVKDYLDSMQDKTTEDKFFYYLSDKSQLQSLVEAAEAGLMEAQHNLGCLYLEGKLNGGSKQAQCWFFLSALQGYTPAKDNLKQFIE